MMQGSVVYAVQALSVCCWLDNSTVVLTGDCAECVPISLTDKSSKHLPLQLKKKFNLCPNLPFDALAKYYPWHVNVSLVNPNSECVRTEAAFQVQEVKPDF